MRPVRNVFQKLSRTEQRREGVVAYLCSSPYYCTLQSENPICGVLIDFLCTVQAGAVQFDGKAYWFAWDSDEEVLRNARWNWFTARNYCRYDSPIVALYLSSPGSQPGTTPGPTHSCLLFPHPHPHFALISPDSSSSAPFILCPYVHSSSAQSFLLRIKV